MAVRILIGDVRERLAELPSDHFDCVVTSPPYWGLRDYGTARWEGGDTGCAHVRLKRGDCSTIDGGHYQSREIYKDRCGLCGALRIDNQIGLEPTLGEHLSVMVGVFREVRRVLKPSGTLWLNYGDCYATSPNGRSAAETKANGGDDRTFRDKPFSTVDGVLWYQTASPSRFKKTGGSFVPKSSGASRMGCRTRRDISEDEAANFLHRAREEERASIWRECA